MLTQEQLKERLEYNPETGLWKWLIVGGSKCKSGWFAGTKGIRGYYYIQISRKSYLAHRLAFLYMTGNFPPLDVDHIDGNPTNNIWINLRSVTKNINLQNQLRPQSNNKSGYLGVCRNSTGKPWRATIMVEGKNKYLGSFFTPQEASEAYQKAKKIYHG